jgi:hypothetical protein
MLRFVLAERFACQVGNGGKHFVELAIGDDHGCQPLSVPAIVTSDGRSFQKRIAGS